MLTSDQYSGLTRVPAPAPHLVVEDGQGLVGGEVLQLGLEDDGQLLPARLHHLLAVVVVQAALVLHQLTHTQVCTHVSCNHTNSIVHTLGREGGGR